MLMSIGPVRFEVAPLNATRVGHRPTSVFADPSTISAMAKLLRRRSLG